jgi:peptidoglycan/LPS O-acetylase OafA/YrhL
MVTVTWSLSYVVASYFVIGLAYRVIGLRERGADFRIVFWALLSVLLFAAWRAGTFAHPRSVHFAVGAVLAEILGGSSRARRFAAVAAALALASLVGGGAQEWVLRSALFGIAVMGDLAWTPIWLEPLANLSYPVFLVHGLVFRAQLMASPPAYGLVDLAASLLAAMATTLAAAYFFRRFLNWAGEQRPAPLTRAA